MSVRKTESEGVANKLSYKYWLFTVKLKLYIKKYNRVLAMPYL